MQLCLKGKLSFLDASILAGLQPWHKLSTTTGFALSDRNPYLTKVAFIWSLPLKDELPLLIICQMAAMHALFDCKMYRAPQGLKERPWIRGICLWLVLQKLPCLGPNLGSCRDWQRDSFNHQATRPRRPLNGSSRSWLLFSGQTRPKKTTTRETRGSEWVREREGEVGMFQSQRSCPRSDVLNDCVI